MYNARSQHDLWKLEEPLILVAPPISFCLSCNRPLRFQLSSSPINVLSATGVRLGCLLKADCRPRRTPCSHSSYFVDSYLTPSMETPSPNSKKRIMYRSDVLKNTGMLRLDQSNYIDLIAAEIWASRVPVMLSSKHWNSQLAYMGLTHGMHQQKIPTPKANPLFKKAYVLLNIINLHDYRSKLDSSLQSLELDHWESSALPCSPGNTLREYNRAMEDYVRFFKENSARKWDHSCKGCHRVLPDGRVVSASVVDGKAMGHQVCQILGCIHPILNPEDGFCRQHHDELGSVCIVRGCDVRANSEKGDKRTCGNPEHIQLYLRSLTADGNGRKVNATNTTSPMDNANTEGSVILPPQKKRKQTSTIDDSFVDKDTFDGGLLKYRAKRRYLPGIFVNVWSCGHIMNIFKMFTFEQTAELLPGISKTYESIGLPIPAFPHQKQLMPLQILTKHDCIGAWWITWSGWWTNFIFAPITMLVALSFLIPNLPTRPFHRWFLGILKLPSKQTHGYSGWQIF
ncbi:hypothetical protein BC829DRAFT_420744 [Chytridium lagenaria]|nr:hypothetical protein BC829DRAFT_420744 [Chytridium lagenaria]